MWNFEQKWNKRSFNCVSRNFYILANLVRPLSRRKMGHFCTKYLVATVVYDSCIQHYIPIAGKSRQILYFFKYCLNYDLISKSENICFEFEKMGKIKPIKSKLKLAKILLDRYKDQTASGFLIKCSDGEFFVDEDCFKFSDFLYEQIQGRSSYFGGLKNPDQKLRSMDRRPWRQPWTVSPRCRVHCRVRIFLFDMYG